MTISEIFRILKLYGFPPDFGWWSSYPRRAAAEILVMKDHTYAALMREGRSMVWDEVITNNYGTRYRIRIVAAENYPWKAPKVFAPGAKPSPHRWGDGSLCLYRPEVYSTKWTILDIRNMACSWAFAHESYLHTGIWTAADGHLPII